MSLENKSGLDNVHQAMLNKRPPAPSSLYYENNFDFLIRHKGSKPKLSINSLASWF